MSIILGNLVTLDAAVRFGGPLSLPRPHVDADPYAALEPFVPANEEQYGAKFAEDSGDALHSDSTPIRFADSLRPELRARMSAAELEEFEEHAHEHFKNRVRRGLLTDSRGLRYSRGELGLARALRDATLVDPATQTSLHTDSDDEGAADLARGLTTAWER